MIAWPAFRWEMMLQLAMEPPPINHGVVLEVTLDDSFRGSTHYNDMITSSAQIGILQMVRIVNIILLIAWIQNRPFITCIFCASSHDTPSRMWDWGPALIPPWRRLSLICFCFCLNSLGVVPIGTNWWAISNLTGVLLCVGELSGTHYDVEKNKKLRGELFH